MMNLDTEAIQQLRTYVEENGLTPVDAGNFGLAAALIGVIDEVVGGRPPLEAMEALFDSRTAEYNQLVRRHSEHGKADFDLMPSGGGFDYLAQWVLSDLTTK